MASKVSSETILISLFANVVFPEPEPPEIPIRYTKILQ